MSTVAGAATGRMPGGPADRKERIRLLIRRIIFGHPDRTRVRPTAVGIWFVIMTLVVGMAAANTGNNILFLVFSLMLGALLVSGVLSRAAMRRLRVSRRPPSTIYAGTPFTESVDVSNEKRVLPSASIRMRTAIATAAVFIPWVPARGSRKQVIEGLYPKRGRFKVERLELSSLFPLGFFERRRTMTSTELVTVFPHVERIVPYFPERSGGIGDRAALLKGEGEDLYQIREYVPGESARFIDWKATSRVARLMARDFHRDSDLRVTLIVDPSAGAPEEVEAVEREISLAASMIDYLHTRQAAYQLLTPDGVLPFGIGPQQYRDALTLLALLPICDHSVGRGFCARISAVRTRDSIPVFFTASVTPSELPIRAWRVLQASPA